MDSNTFMGMLIAAIAVIVSIVFTILNYFQAKNTRNKKSEDLTTQSINELNTNIKLLNATIAQLNKDVMNNTIRQENLENKVNTHDLWLHNDDLRIDNHERRLKKLDNEEGVKKDRRNGKS